MRFGLLRGSLSLWNDEILLTRWGPQAVRAMPFNSLPRASACPATKITSPRMRLIRRPMESTSLGSSFLPSRIAIQLTRRQPQSVHRTPFSSHGGSSSPYLDAIHPTPAAADVPRDGLHLTPKEPHAVSQEIHLAPRDSRLVHATPFNSSRARLMASRDAIHEHGGTVDVRRAGIHCPPAETHGHHAPTSSSSRRDSPDLTIGFSSSQSRFMSYRADYPFSSPHLVFSFARSAFNAVGLTVRTLVTSHLTTHRRDRADP